MAQTLMQQLVKYEGACCIFKYFKDNASKSNREMAEHLGVTDHTIMVWRQKIKAGKVGCGYGSSGLTGCINK